MSDSRDSPEPDTGATLEMYCPQCDRSCEDTNAQHCPHDGTKLVRFTPETDQLIGRRLDDRFTIREKLGAGGMGTVYRALQSSVGREVAIKVIEARYASNRHAAKRFLREAKLASRLSQPNTVGVIDFGQSDDGLLFLVMELLKGQTLKEVLRRDGVFSETRTVRIGVQLCDALEAAHALKIVHRDLKPANIIVLDDPPGRDLLKVLDFGLAKSFLGDDTHSVTQSDVVVGTPSYIAPEVVEGLAPDPRTDLYSLGVILYELVSGRRPFIANNVSQLFAMHLDEPPPPLTDVGPELNTAIMRLLEKEPHDRFANAADARTALVHASESNRARVSATVTHSSDEVSGLDTTATSIPRPNRLDTATAQPTKKSRSAVVVLSLVVMVAGLATLAMAMGWLGGDSKPPATQTKTEAATVPAAGPTETAPGVANKLAGKAPATTATGTTATETTATETTATETTATETTATANTATETTAPATKVTITFDASPRADVWLDGTHVGKTPHRATITSGTLTHKVVFKRRGRRSKAKTFKPDKDKKITVTLERTPARHRRTTKPTTTRRPPNKITKPVEPKTNVTSPYLDPDED